MYLPRDQGGRGLISVEACVRIEEHSLSDYLKMNDTYRQCLQEYIKTKSSTQVRTDTAQEYEKDWKEKTLHGQFVKLTESSNQNSWNWIKQGWLKKETEGLLTAAQDQALPTRWRKTFIEGRQTNSECRMCGNQQETVMHILSECSKLAQNEFKKRHDKVATILHWALCKQHQLEHSENWYDHRAPSVHENDQVKILWDYTIQTDQVVTTRRPDIVSVDKNLDHTWVIDIAVPGDGRVEEKEKEKVFKYQDLARQIQKIWKTSVNVIPIIVVGTLGTYNRIEEYTQMLGVCPSEVRRMQMAALLGSAHILRKVLDISDQ